MPRTAKRPAPDDPKDSSSSEPDLKRVREAVAAPTRLPDGTSGSEKRTSWAVFPWKNENEGRKKWPRQKEPITNIENIPESWQWDPNDLDLDQL